MDDWESWDDWEGWSGVEVLAMQVFNATLNQLNRHQRRILLTRLWHLYVDDRLPPVRTDPTT